MMQQLVALLDLQNKLEERETKRDVVINLYLHINWHRVFQANVP
jgi:hypothetical protein